MNKDYRDALNEANHKLASDVTYYDRFKAGESVMSLHEEIMLAAIARGEAQRARRAAKLEAFFLIALIFTVIFTVLVLMGSVTP